MDRTQGKVAEGPFSLCSKESGDVERGSEVSNGFLVLPIHLEEDATKEEAIGQGFCHLKINLSLYKRKGCEELTLEDALGADSERRKSLVSLTSMSEGMNCSNNDNASR